MKWLALAVVLVGCGPSPYIYERGCVTINSDLELIEERVNAYIDAARDIYEVRFGDFCEVASGYIHVKDVDVFSCPFATTSGLCIGHADIFGNVELSRRGAPAALLHELLHVRDNHRLSVGTAWHENWDVNGYYEADAEFKLAIADIGPPF